MPANLNYTVDAARDRNASALGLSTKIVDTITLRDPPLARARSQAAYRSRAPRDAR